MIDNLYDRKTLKLNDLYLIHVERIYLYLYIYIYIKSLKFCCLIFNEGLGLQFDL